MAEKRKTTRILKRTTILKPTLADFSTAFKEELNLQLLAAGIYTKHDDLERKKEISRTFHFTICLNNRMWSDLETIAEHETRYRKFFDWTINGDHDFKFYTISDYARAFKQWVATEAKPANSYYKATEIDYSAMQGGNMKSLSTNQLWRTKGLIEWMDLYQPESGAIGSKITKWSNSPIYHNYISTLKSRGVPDQELKAHSKRVREYYKINPSGKQYHGGI